ncbi:MAG: YfhO family protein [Thermoanaerobaculum sp.]|nr:YfhO family protein [Thermoanaerobaculum sp.]
MSSKAALFLVGAVWLGLLLAGKVVVTRDIGATHIPWRLEWARQVRQGWVPLWNPRCNGGRPLWADPNTQAAYPPTLLFALLPAEHAMVVFLGAHHLLLLAGFGFLTRRLGYPNGLANTAALVGATSGVALSLTTFPNALASFAWIPWAVGLLCSKNPTPRASLACGGLLGLSFLAGEPVTAALGVVVALLVGGVQRLGWGMLPGVLGGFFLVSAPVLLPLASLFPETVRGALGVREGALAADALAPRRWLELFFPRLLGEPLGDGATGFWAAASFPWQRYYPLIFLGAGPLACILLGARKTKGVQTLFLVLFFTGLAASLLAAWPAGAEFLARLPGGKAWRFGIKFLQLSLLATPPLVAAGLERWTGRRPRVSLLVLGLLLLLPAVFAQTTRRAVAQLYPASALALAEVPVRRWTNALWADGLTNAAPLWALAAGLGASGFGVVCFLAHAPLWLSTHVVVDSQAWKNPPATVTVLGKGEKVAAFWRVTRELGTDPKAQTFAYRHFLVPDYGLTFGLSYALARGPDGLEPVRGELLAQRVEALPPAERLRAVAALGGGAMVVPWAPPELACPQLGAAVLCRARRPAPEAYLVRRAFPAYTLEETVAWLASESFQPGEDAVLEGLPSPVELLGGEVVEEGGSPHGRRFQVRSAGRTWLVVQENYLSSWRAWLDGQAVELRVANGSQMAVPIPAGQHQVELSLDPTPYTLGALGPLLFLVIGVGWRTGGRRESTGGRGHNTPARERGP